MVAASRRRPSCSHEHTHHTYPRDPPPAAQPLGPHGRRRQRRPCPVLRDPPRRLPRRLRRPHPPRRGRHPHLRGRGARHARRGQGGLDRDGCPPQPARPAVAVDRPRAPRGRRSHPPVTRHPVAERRLLVPVPGRGRRDPLDHAPARRHRTAEPRRPPSTAAAPTSPRRSSRSKTPGACGGSASGSRSRSRRSSPSCSSPSPPSSRCSTSTSATASATATSRSRASRTCRATTSSASARSTSISGELKVPRRRDPRRCERRRRRSPRDRPGRRRPCRRTDRPRSARSISPDGVGGDGRNVESDVVETGPRVLVIDGHAGVGSVRVERALR